MERVTFAWWSTSIRDNMYEVVLSGETTIGKVQKCMRELEPKAMWCDFDMEKSTLVVDDTDCNQDDVKGTILTSIGVDYITEFKDIS